MPTDPREKLMIVGNRLLDSVFELGKLMDEDNDVHKILLATSPEEGGEAMREYAAKHGFAEAGATMLSLIQLGNRLTAGIREYTAIRATLEAVDTPRPDMPSTEPQEPVSDVIYTDAYGTIPRADYERYQALNVSPSSFDSLVDQFGRNHARIRQFVEKHVVDGSYRAPWPLG